MAKVFENPYRASSSYGCIAAILAKSVGTWIHQDEILKQFPKAMGDNFKDFKNKKARNKNGLKSWEEKVIQNSTVICRTDKYGLPKASGYIILKKLIKGDKGSSYQFGLFSRSMLPKAAK